MKKIYLPLLKEQRERNIYFSSTLSAHRFETTETTRHEISLKELQEDSNEGFVEAAPHSHHFKNIPLRLTDGNQSLRTIAQGEGININGYQAQAQPVVHEYKEPTNTPTPPRALTVDEAFLDPHDRTRLEPRGQIMPEPPDIPKDGAFPADFENEPGLIDQLREEGF